MDKRFTLKVASVCVAIGCLIFVGAETGFFSNPYQSTYLFTSKLVEIGAIWKPTNRLLESTLTFENGEIIEFLDFPVTMNSLIVGQTYKVYQHWDGGFSLHLVK